MAANSVKNVIRNGNSAMISDLEKDNQNLLPHLESLERFISLPCVGAAWQQSQSYYGKVKSNNRLFNWALNTAEDCVQRAVSSAAPIVFKLDGPIQYVDQTIVKGIDKLEVTAPIIKDTPIEIYNQAKTKVIDAVQPTIDRVAKFKAVGQQKASSLKELAWQKANEVLATQYGCIAVNGVDTTSALAERLLEYYFPNSETDVDDEQNDKAKVIFLKVQNEQKSKNEIPVPATEDPVLHTVQTVGRLSNKISRRVYRTVSTQIKQLNKENVNDYLASLIAALRLTQYINFINSSMGNNEYSQTQSVLNSSGGGGSAGMGVGGVTKTISASSNSKNALALTQNNKLI